MAQRMKRSHPSVGQEAGTGSVTRRRFLVGFTSLAAGLGALGRTTPRAFAQAAARPRKAPITYWTPLDPKAKNPRSAAETEMIALFRKKYPEIAVEVQAVPWQVIGNQTLQAVNAGRGPDVVQFSTYDLPIQVQAKTVQPLDEFLSKDWLKANKDDFLLPWENTVYDGHMTAFYWNSTLSNILWYRKDLLEKKGLRAPESWDEIASVAVALQTPQIVGYLHGLAKSGNAVNLTNWLVPSLWAVGAELLGKDGRAAFNTEAGAKPLTWLYEMVYKHKATPANIVALSRDNVLDAFKAGTAAMATMSSNVVSSARASTVVGKIMAMAAHPSPTRERPMPALVVGKTIGMTKIAKEKEAAWLFIEHMVSPEAQLVNAKIAGELPCRKSVLKDPWFQTPEGADMKLEIEYMIHHPHTFQYHPKNNILADLLAEAAQQVIANHRPPREALDEAARKWNREIGLG